MAGLSEACACKSTVRSRNRRPPFHRNSISRSTNGALTACCPRTANTRRPSGRVSSATSRPSSTEERSRRAAAYAWSSARRAWRLWLSLALSRVMGNSARRGSPREELTTAGPRVSDCAAPAHSNRQAAVSRASRGPGACAVLGGMCRPLTVPGRCSAAAERRRRTGSNHFSNKMRSMRRSGSAAPHSSWSPTVKAPR